MHFAAGAHSLVRMTALVTGNAGLFSDRAMLVGADVTAPCSGECPLGNG
jgi:hypothetical protein